MLRNAAKSPRSRRPAVRVMLESLERREVMSSAGVALSEVVPTPYPTRYPNQYIEVQGPANQSLAGVEFVQFDGYGGGSPTGKATYVKDLSSYSLGANGLLIIEADKGGPTPFEGSTTVVTDPGFDYYSTPPVGGYPAGLHGGTEFYALVDTSNGSGLTQGAQYDALNSGTLTLPTGDAVVDGVSFVYNSAPNSTDREYNVTQTVGGTATTLPGSDFYLPLTGKTPDAASRVANDTTTYTSSAYDPTQHFYYGYLKSGTSFYDATADAGQQPANGGALTPGGSNADLVVSLQQTTVNTTAGSTVILDILAGNGVFPAGQSITVNSFNGTAVNGTDYNFTNQTVAIPTTSGTGPIDIQIPVTISTGAMSGTFFNIVLQDPTSGFHLVKPKNVQIQIN